MSALKLLGTRIREARKAKGWSQAALGRRADVGGPNPNGQTKAIQRVERGEVDNSDVLRRVISAVGIEVAPHELPRPETKSASRARTKRAVVTDGQACVGALLALELEAWPFISVELDHDFGDDDDIDAAVLAVTGVVDWFHGRLATVTPGEAIASTRPEMTLSMRYAFGVQIRKAVAALSRASLELWLIDIWKTNSRIDCELLTRVFRVAPRASVADGTWSSGPTGTRTAPEDDTTNRGATSGIAVNVSESTYSSAQQS